MRWTWPYALAAAGAGLAALLVARKVSDGGGLLGGGSISPVDPYAPQEPEDACDPTAKPGVLAFRAWVLGKWGERAGSPQNIVRGCDVGGPSGHKQGKAWDQMVTDQAQGQAVVDALMATDSEGNPHALARRAGIRYLIWAGKMWRSYPHAGLPSGSWAPYSGGESGSQHFDHLHYSFSADGAAGLTSLYGMIGSGDVA